jgi:hypothetical protein
MSQQTDNPSAQNPAEENPVRRPWVKPALERLSLNAALGSGSLGVPDASSGAS